MDFFLEGFLFNIFPQSSSFGFEQAGSDVDGD